MASRFQWNHHEAMRPDWVMLGVPRPGGGVRLYASRELTHAELELRLEHDVRAFLDGDLAGLSERMDINVGMRHFTLVEADTYPEALAHLLDVWSPEPQPTAPAGALPAGRPALGDGPV
jgi:hypothetical protein